MKKNCYPGILAIIAAISLVSGACALKEDPPIQGTIQITIDGPDAAALSVSSEEGSGLSDEFLVMAYNDTSIHWAHVEDSGTQSLSVDPGDYRIIVLAGVGSQSSDYCLVGSGSVGDVQVAPDSITPVDVVLRPVINTVTVASQVSTGGVLSFSWSGDSRCPQIQPSFEGSYSTQRMSFKLPELSASPISCTPVTQGSSWECSGSQSMPASPLDITLTLAGSRLALVDEAMGRNAFLGDLVEEEWRWLSSVLIDSEDPLARELYFPVSVLLSGSGVSVGVSWE